jgi:hypothetical protein
MNHVIMANALKCVTLIQVNVFEDHTGSTRLPNEALLGVPRAGYQPVAASTSADGSSRSGRTVRSSSSDAAAELRQDSNPQSPTAGETSNQPRRTSDPLSNSTNAAAAMANGVAEGGRIEIVVSQEPGQMDTCAVASPTSIDNLVKNPSSSYLAATSPFGGLSISTNPSSTPFDYFRSSSATSLRHLPASTAVYRLPPQSSVSLAASAGTRAMTESSSSSHDGCPDSRSDLRSSSSICHPSVSTTSLQPPNPFQTPSPAQSIPLSYSASTNAPTSPVILPPPPPTIHHSRSFGVVGPPHRVVEDFSGNSAASSTSSLLLSPFQTSSLSTNRTGVVASVSACSLYRQQCQQMIPQQQQQYQGPDNHRYPLRQHQPLASSLSTGGAIPMPAKIQRRTTGYATDSDNDDYDYDDDDDIESTKVSCGGVSRRPGNGFRLLDRSSESTPLLCHHGGGGSGGGNVRHGTGFGMRRVEVPTTLVCCTPPRRRPSPSEQQLLSAVYSAAAVLPSPTPSPPTDTDDVIGYCGPATLDDAAVVERRRRQQQQQQLAVARPKGRHGGSLRVRSRSRTAALMNAIHEKSQSIDLADS